MRPPVGRMGNRSQDMPRRDGAWHCLSQAGRGPPFHYQSSTLYSSRGSPHHPYPPTPHPGLHILEEVLAGRPLRASPTSANGDMKSTTNNSWSYWWPFSPPTPSLFSQLCAGFKTTRDVLGGPSLGNPVSVTQVQCDLSPTAEEEEKVVVVTGQVESPGGTSKTRCGPEGQGPNAVHDSCFFKISLSKPLTPLARICLYLRPWGVDAFPAPAESLLKQELFLPASGIVLLKTETRELWFMDEILMTRGKKAHLANKFQDKDSV